jgi:hypothetical protein
MIVLPLILDLHFLDLVTSWRWVVSLTPVPLCPRGKTPGTHWIGGWVGPRACVDDEERRKFLTLPRFKLQPSFIQPVASHYTDYTVDPYLHSFIRLHGVVFNYLSTGNNFIFLLPLSYSTANVNVDELSLLPVRLRLRSKQEFKDFILCSVN